MPGRTTAWRSWRRPPPGRAPEGDALTALALFPPSRSTGSSWRQLRWVRHRPRSSNLPAASGPIGHLRSHTCPICAATHDSDQPHMTREFTRLVGVRPAQLSKDAKRSTLLPSGSSTVAQRCHQGASHGLVRPSYPLRSDQNRSSNRHSDN